MIKAIFFDFDGILTYEAKDGKQTCRSLALQTQLPYEKLFELYESYNKELMTGEITHSELATIFSNKFNHPFTKEMFLRAFAHTSKNEDMLTYIKKIRSEGMKTGLITNNSLERMQVLNELFKFDELFDTTICAAEFGSLKTDGELFDIALKALDVKAREAIFIDDSEHNVEIANTKGLQAIQFYSLENALCELTKKVEEIKIEIN